MSSTRSPFATRFMRAEQLSDLTPANPESVPPLGPQQYAQLR